MKNILFPALCVLCRQRSEGQAYSLCAHCERALVNLRDQPKCSTCGVCLSVAETVCGQCLQQTPAYDCCVPAFAYEPLMTYLITQLKFHGQLLIAPVLSALMMPSLQAVYADADFPERIIPVPLHPRRLWRRGFNQSIVLARLIANTLGTPLDLALLRREKNTKAQAHLSAKERLQNMRHAFVAQKNQYQHVALLDDVVTTGATVNAAAKALKQVGVQRVDVWCVARVSV